MAVSKVSEKSLELNVGAELLDVMRRRWRMRKAYLRGLTQAEEHREGVDVFARMPSSTRVLAFQFKAPKGQWGDVTPYRFTIQRDQHDSLSHLASIWPTGVFYVLPFFVEPAKLQHEVPHLLRDTWLLRVADMLGMNVFGQYRTKTVYCEPGKAWVNPEYHLANAAEVELGPDAGIPVRQFAEWYGDLRGHSDVLRDRSRRKSPWLVRGLRVAIAHSDFGLEPRTRS